MARGRNVTFSLLYLWCFHNLTKSPNRDTNQVTMDSFKNTNKTMDFTVCVMEEVLCGHQLAALLLHKQKVFLIHMKSSPTNKTKFNLTETFNSTLALRNFENFQ